MKIRIYDIETLAGMFLASFYNPENDQWREFEISPRVNNIDEMVKYLAEEPVDYYVGFNNLSFDAQVIQFIIEKHERWVNLPVLTPYLEMYQEKHRGNNALFHGGIVNRIYQFSQDVIDDTNHGLFPPYREEGLSFKQIDLFSIHGFGNESIRASLKWIEFMVDLPDVDEMPIHHTVDNLTVEQMDRIRKYCRNDILATHKFWFYTTGEVDNEEYKGKNKIQERLDFIQEFNFEENAINYSNIKIGEEYNLRGYCDLKGITKKEVKELKKKRKSNRGFNFSDCIPDYVEFKTPEFNHFKKLVGRERVNLNEAKQEFPFTYNGTTYIIAKGGIHSEDPKRVIKPNANELLIDCDISSQYPTSIIKREIYPSHLGKEWLVNYGKMTNVRIQYKSRGAEHKKYKGVADTLKDAINGGAFGKLNERTSWQYDPFAAFKCTIGNQFEILMLIEELELNGIHVVSANTDGIMSLFSSDKYPRYQEICKWWEEKVGNIDMGRLEFTEFEQVAQLSVNNYIAIKKGGEVKKKGKDFATDHKLYKNKSRRIVALALESYFTKATDPEEFIKNHTNIFDFCIGVKASKDYHYETIKRGTAEKVIFHRLVRYIVTTEGELLLKIKNKGSEAKGNQISNCEAPDKDTDKVWLTTVVNSIDPKRPISEYKLDYSYYINKVTKIIQLVEKKKKTTGKKKIEDKNQISLF